MSQHNIWGSVQPTLRYDEDEDPMAPDFLDDMISGYTDMIVKSMVSRWSEWSDEPIKIETWTMDPQTDKTGLKDKVHMTSASTRHGMIAMGCGTDIVDALEALTDSLLFLRSFGHSDPTAETIRA
jgi:hypothetical protein